MQLGHNMPKPGDTRWLSRDTAISVIDSHYETIGTVLYELANSSTESTDTKASALALGMQLQTVEFVFLLKLYRKIFEYCTPIINMMQKLTLDAVSIKSMLEDFQLVLSNLGYDQIWEDTLEADPEMPVVRSRGAWRNMEPENSGTRDSWKEALFNLGKEIAKKFSDELTWQFANFEKFKWMDLVHPSKFEQRKDASAKDQRLLIEELQKLHPFAVSDIIETENNLKIMYENSQISLLLQKMVRERDTLVAKKIKRRKQLVESTLNEGNSLEETDGEANVEENDEFEVEENANVELASVKEGKASIQDLLSVIKNAGLEEALLWAVPLLELAVVTPLTSVHCERVFSRMKRVVSPARSNMSQTRKENLVLLQVEHNLLRWLSRKPMFKENVVARFKGLNPRRFERFSRK